MTVTEQRVTLYSRTITQWATLGNISELDQIDESIKAEIINSVESLRLAKGWDKWPGAEITLSIRDLNQGDYFGSKRALVADLRCALTKDQHLADDLEQVSTRITGTQQALDRITQEMTKLDARLAEIKEDLKIDRRIQADLLKQTMDLNG